MLREVVYNDWFTIALMLGLASVALCKFLYAHRFSDFITVLGNSKYLKIYARDQKFIDGFDALFFINFIISFSVFAYIAYSTLIGSFRFNLDLFFKMIFGIGVLVLAKTLLERLLGSLFEIDGLIDTYLFQKTTYKNFTGFFLLPINCIILYAITPSISVIYIIFILIGVINSIGFLSSFKNHQKMLLNNIFYFILYLCALEIGPYLILAKLIIDFNA